METLIICESVHHGNTKKVADAMAGALAATVVKPGEVDIGKLQEYDLIGFGSGIYMGKHHKNLIGLAKEMPALHKKAFVFSTAGGEDATKNHKQLKDILIGKGFEIVGEFGCKGYDTFGPLLLVGGVNKGKPDAKDLDDARQFAAGLPVA
jgi:flavodoxin